MVNMKKSTAEVNTDIPSLGFLHLAVTRQRSHWLESCATSLYET
jgi:hypothetical protein